MASFESLVPGGSTVRLIHLEDSAIGDVTVLALSGRMVRNENFGALQDKVRHLVQEGRRKLVLDLAGVSYMDSTCHGEIVSGFVTVRRNGGLLHFASPTARVERLMTTAGLATTFRTFPSEREAVSSLAGPLLEH